MKSKKLILMLDQLSTISGTSVRAYEDPPLSGITVINGDGECGMLAAMTRQIRGQNRLAKFEQRHAPGGAAFSSVNRPKTHDNAP